MPEARMETGEIVRRQIAPQARTSPRNEVLGYPAVAAPPMPSWEAFSSLASTGSLGDVPADAPEAEAERTDLGAREAELADQIRRSFETGRERGFQEGRAAEQEAHAASRKASDTGRIGQVARFLEDFHLERNRYFESVEQEVVKLALAVAARILRREAQMDPLLLSGAVRVALGQLSASTQVRLRVPSTDLDLWSDTMAHLPNLAVKPSVLGEDEMRLGECVLETELGSVNLGVAAQLAEIERGFFDRAGGNSVTSKSIAVREDMSE
jgi:flagellar assembly protein FliH